MPRVRCRECGAPVRFVKMRTGARMPVDVGRTPDIEPNVAAMIDSRRELIDGYVITEATPLKLGYRALVPHFASCPERPSAPRREPDPTLF